MSKFVPLSELNIIAEDDNRILLSPKDRIITEVSAGMAIINDPLSEKSVGFISKIYNNGVILCLKGSYIDAMINMTESLRNEANRQNSSVNYGDLVVLPH